VLVKETGVPSGPAEQGFDEAGQAEFWRALAQRLPPARTHAFAYFEAFDAPWKTASVAAQTGDVRASEAHWGLYRADGTAKPAALAVPAR
jgi:exo-beta-1,3-glucanase (GH17 family)